MSWIRYLSEFQLFRSLSICYSSFLSFFFPCTISFSCHFVLTLKLTLGFVSAFLTLSFLLLSRDSDVHAELAATRKELQSLLAGKERIEKEAVETVANAEKAMRAELEEAEREMGEEKDLLLVSSED